MDDFARSTNAGRILNLAGCDFRVGKISPRDLGDLQAWLKREAPDPREKVAELMRGQADAVALEMWRQASAAAEAWPPPLDSPQGRSLLLSPEGMSQLLWIALRRHTPGFSLDAARELADRITPEEFLDVQRAVSPGDPKAPPPETMETSPASP